MRNLLKKLDMVTEQQIAAFVAKLNPSYLATDQYTIVTVGCNAVSTPELNFHWGKVAPVVGSIAEVEFGYYQKVVAVLDKKESQ